MGKLKKLAKGTVYQSNQYGEFKVLEDTGAFNVEIEFLITGYTKVVQRGNVKRGNVKDPYYHSVYGIAWLGEGEYTARVGGDITDAYAAWTGMLCRCYGTVGGHHWKSYRDNVNVCSEWLCFQDFAAWYEESDITGFDLDKDLFSGGDKKEYSPMTCVFLPPRLNKCFIDQNNKRGDLPRGVTSIQNDIGYIARLNVGNVREYLGYFLCPIEAFSVYKSAKESLIKSLATKCREEITPIAFNKLMTYKVIDDSPWKAHLRIEEDNHGNL